MELQDMEKQKYNIPLKEIRAKQLDILKNGTTTGDYYITVTSFDGRTISRINYQTYEDMMQAYTEAQEAWKYNASVSASVEFNIK